MNYHWREEYFDKLEFSKGYYMLILRAFEDDNLQLLDKDNLYYA